MYDEENSKKVTMDDIELSHGSSKTMKHSIRMLLNSCFEPAYFKNTINVAR
ncbi:12423_t:CDS:2 [Funneliformis caledonium]|uniref:12423_t:CDS:1 n=1 Tax=Funneliformis caledonium TaxID=1117310 RepID=A0A9N8WHP1_9GLOM|nr:12423_t:CDS:2 [Funneliformis caledonium]